MRALGNGYLATFYTPRALIWNIKTLGFECWLKCLMINMRLAAAEQRKGLSAMRRSLS